MTGRTGWVSGVMIAALVAASLPDQPCFACVAVRKAPAAGQAKPPCCCRVTDSLPTPAAAELPPANDCRCHLNNAPPAVAEAAEPFRPDLSTVAWLDLPRLLPSAAPATGIGFLEHHFHRYPVRLHNWLQVWLN